MIQARRGFLLTRRQVDERHDNTICRKCLATASFYGCRCPLMGRSNHVLHARMSPMVSDLQILIAQAIDDNCSVRFHDCQSRL